MPSLRGNIPCDVGTQLPHIRQTSPSPPCWYLHLTLVKPFCSTVAACTGLLLGYYCLCMSGPKFMCACVFGDKPCVPFFKRCPPFAPLSRVSHWPISSQVGPAASQRDPVTHLPPPQHRDRKPQSPCSPFFFLPWCWGLNTGPDFLYPLNYPCPRLPSLLTSFSKIL